MGEKRLKEGISSCLTALWWDISFFYLGIQTKKSALPGSPVLFNKTNKCIQSEIVFKI
jgi:hypothetical protein